MKKSIYITLLASTFALTSCKGQEKSSINQNIEPKQFAENVMGKQVQLVDVRTPDEFNNQHIENAVNYNINDSVAFDTNAAKLDKNQPVYVYCLSGGRSSRAASKLQEMGFKEVYNLSGGITKWNAEGFGKPVNNGGLSLAEFNKITTSDKKVLIDVYAEWCGPCKKMAPYLEKMKAENKGKMTIVKLDADKNQALAKELKIEGLPTLLYYIDGKLQWQNLGFISEEDLKKKL